MTDFLKDYILGNMKPINYMDLEYQLRRALPGACAEDASGIIWFDIMDNIEMYGFSGGFEDCCHYVMEEMDVDVSRLNGLIRDHERRGSRYEKNLYQYAFDAEMDKLGQVWQVLIVRERRGRIQQLLNWLEMYWNVVVPYVRKTVEEWMTIHFVSPAEEEEIHLLQELYAQKMRGCMQTLKIAMSMMKMPRYDDPDDPEESIPATFDEHFLNSLN